MIKINLLPKEMRKVRGLRISKTALAGVGLMVAVFGVFAVITMFQAFRLNNIEDQIAEVRRQADRMRNDIMLVDRLVDVKAKILSRLAAIDKLDRGRERSVIILNELAGLVPDFLWLTAFKPAGPISKNKKGGRQSPSTVTLADTVATTAPEMILEGYSFTLNGLATFLTELNESVYFDNIAFAHAKIEEVQQQAIYNFAVRCRLAEPEAVGEIRDVEPTDPNELAENTLTAGVAALLDE